MTPPDSPYLLAVQMDVDPEHLATFHEVYDSEHVPALLNVPGVRSVRRTQRIDNLSIAFGGDVRVLTFPSEPRFSALYELDSPQVLLSAEWAEAVELGRWSSVVRPYTTNRRHILHQLLLSARNS